MDDGHFLVGAQGGFAVTQDALGKGGGMTEFLVKVIIVTSSLVTVIYVGHHAAVTGDLSAAHAFLLADGFIFPFGTVIKTAGRPLITTATTVFVTATAIVIKTAPASALSVLTSARTVLTFFTAYLAIIALAALAGAETLVADMLATFAQFVIGAVKNDIIQQHAVQSLQMSQAL